MSYLVLVRHGESTWNVEKRFSGWTDVMLTMNGIEQAEKTGRQLSNINFDQYFTSPLSRAKETALLILEQNQNTMFSLRNLIEVQEFIERDYGDLTGLTHAETVEKHSDDQVNIWRRDYNTPPPNGECLADVYKRAVPFFKKHVEPSLEFNNVLIVSHRNPQKALIQYIEDLSEDEIRVIEPDNGTPYIYECFQGKMTKISA